jgi:hypothetical protein
MAPWTLTAAAILIFMGCKTVWDAHKKERAARRERAEYERLEAIRKEHCRKVGDYEQAYKRKYGHIPEFYEPFDASLGKLCGLAYDPYYRDPGEQESYMYPHGRPAQCASCEELEARVEQLEEECASRNDSCW